FLGNGALLEWGPPRYRMSWHRCVLPRSKRPRCLHTPASWRTADRPYVRLHQWRVCWAAPKAEAWTSLGPTLCPTLGPQVLAAHWARKGPANTVATAQKNPFLEMEIHQPRPSIAPHPIQERTRYISSR